MTLFKYTAVDRDGNERVGEVEAYSQEIAISTLQERGLIISSISSGAKKSIFEANITLGGVSNREIVILSKQLATLFDAQVSPLRIFRMIGQETESDLLRETLAEIAADISDGSSVKITIARWLTPDGTSISDGGLKPDLTIPRTPQQRLDDVDPQLEAALEFLGGKSIEEILTEGVPAAEETEGETSPE